MHMAMHMAMGLFRRQDQHGDNSRDIDQHSAHGNEEEQQVQDGGRGVSDGAHEKTQIQDAGLKELDSGEANHDMATVM